MGIYYYKLWDMLESRNITQRELIENLHLSTATLTKMRKNQTVSMETIDLIREYLGCDYGDMITAEPMAEGVEFNWQGEGVATKTNEVYRIALIEYMETQSLTPQTVADITTLSLNTVKSFIKGKTLSSRSLVKLMRLGNVYNARVGELLTEYDVKDKVYCIHTWGRRKCCFAYVPAFNSDTGKYEPHCNLGFPVKPDKNGDVFGVDGCPHPKNSKEYGLAAEKCGFHPRNLVEHIPGKDENNC